MVNDLEYGPLNLNLNVPDAFILGRAELDSGPATFPKGGRKPMSRHFTIRPEMQIDRPDVGKVSAFALDQFAKLPISGSMARQHGLQIRCSHAKVLLMPPNGLRLSGDGGEADGVRCSRGLGALWGTAAEICTMLSGC
jgi:hypothetical protein